MKMGIALLLALLLPLAACAENLKKGSTGGEVQRLEERLLELCYFSGTPDETYDRETETAVHAFRRDAGLKTGKSADEGMQSLLYSDDAWRIRLESLSPPDTEKAARAMKSAATRLHAKGNDDGTLLIQAANYEASFEMALIKNWNCELRVTFALRQDDPLYSGDTVTALLTLRIQEPPADGVVTITGSGWQATERLDGDRLTLQLTDEAGAAAALLDGSLTCVWDAGSIALEDFTAVSDEVPRQLQTIWKNLNVETVLANTEIAGLCRAHLSE